MYETFSYQNLKVYYKKWSSFCEILKKQNNTFSHFIEKSLKTVSYKITEFFAESQVKTAVQKKKKKRNAYGKMEVSQGVCQHYNCNSKLS